MPIYVSLIRGINVGGNNLIEMAALKQVFESLGLTRPRTYLQSGNVVFETSGSDTEALERKVEVGIQQHFGVAPSVIVRTAEELHGIVMLQPYRAEVAPNPSWLVAMFFKTAPTELNIESLRSSYSGPETMHFSGKNAYFYYAQGIGSSKLTIALVEKRLGAICTGRNFNTVKALLARSEEAGA